MFNGLRQNGSPNCLERRAGPWGAQTRTNKATRAASYPGGQSEDKRGRRFQAEVGELLGPGLLVCQLERLGLRVPVHDDGAARLVWSERKCKESQTQIRGDN